MESIPARKISLNQFHTGYILYAKLATLRHTSCNCKNYLTKKFRMEINLYFCARIAPGSAEHG